MDKFTINTLSEALDRYNVREISAQLLPLGQLFLKENRELGEKMGLRKQAVNFFLSGRKLKKADAVAICIFPFANKHVYQKWKAMLTEEQQTVWDLMLWEEKMGEDAIFEKTGIRISNKKKQNNSRYGYSYDRNIENLIRPEFKLFKTYNAGYWNSAKVGIGIPQELRQILIGYYDLPEEAQIISIENPESTEFIFKNGDHTTLSELARIHLYYSQKNIAVTGKDRPKHTTLSKMHRTLNLREFFPNDKDKKLKHLRTNFLAGLIVHISLRSKLSEPITYLKEKMFDVFLTKAHTAALTLTDLKGMGYLDGYDFYDVESTIIREIVSSFPEGWIDFERIHKNFKFKLIARSVIRPYSASGKLHYVYSADEEIGGKIFHRRNAAHHIDGDRYEKSISEPYLKGFFFFLAALGMADLAYNRPNRETVGLTCQSAYDGLRYIRITPLGWYLLGRKEEFETPEIGGGNSFVFSPDALTITLDGDDSAASFVLEPYAVRVGPSRFATETSVFLKGISTKKALEQKIELFRQVTKVKIPKNWEDFFTEMLQKVDPFEKAEDFVIYKLPEANRGLIKLIAQDKILKNYSLKAEGYHVLVPKSKNSAFKKRLLEFGYLIT